MDRQDSPWDQLLPTQARILSAESTAVDECLADGEVEHHAVLVLADPLPGLRFNSRPHLTRVWVPPPSQSTIIPRQGLLTLRTRK